MGFPKSRLAAGLIALAVVLGSFLHLACNDTTVSPDTEVASSSDGFRGFLPDNAVSGQQYGSQGLSEAGEFRCTTLTGYKVWVDTEYLSSTLNYEISGLPPNIVNGHEEGYIFQVWWAGHAGGNADPGTYDPTVAEMNANHRVYNIGAGPDINGSQSFTYPASLAGKKLKVVIYLQPKRERLSDDPNGQCDRGRYTTPELPPPPPPSCIGPRCNPTPECKEGEVRDPITNQCAPVCNLQQSDFLRGLGVTEDVSCVCPEGYTKDSETGICNPNECPGDLVAANGLCGCPPETVPGQEPDSCEKPKTCEELNPPGSDNIDLSYSINESLTCKNVGLCGSNGNFCKIESGKCIGKLTGINYGNARIEYSRSNPFSCSMAVHNGGVWKLILRATDPGNYEKKVVTASIACGSDTTLSASYDWKGHSSRNWSCEGYWNGSLVEQSGIVDGH